MLNSEIIKMAGKKRLSQKELLKIYNIYEKVDGNSREASRRLGHSPERIKSQWKKKGLKSKGTPGIKITERDKKKIVDSYDNVRGNATEASRRLGHHVDTILKYWKLNGLDAIGDRLSEEDKKSIPELFNKFEGKLELVAEELDFGLQSVRKHLKEINFSNDDFVYRGYSSPEEYFLANKDKFEGMSRYAVSKLDPGLYGTLSRHGLLEKLIPERKIEEPKSSLSQEEKDTIVELFLEKPNINLISRKLNISSHKIVWHLKTNKIGKYANL